ncbi:MAG: hypothetical protein C5B49_02800 [Bdellovibrio sp.]|nr:MAG: hypothetical protein C5B49_02800 [Bdellovibrio sp.]
MLLRSHINPNVSWKLPLWSNAGRVRLLIFTLVVCTATFLMIFRVDSAIEEIDRRVDARILDNGEFAFRSGCLSALGNSWVAALTCSVNATKFREELKAASGLKETRGSQVVN